MVMIKQLPLLAALLLALSRCASSTPSGEGITATSVSGAVTSADRVVLPSDASVQVLLTDITSNRTVGEQVIDRPGQMPVPFRIEFARSMIDPNHAYSVEARILIGGKMAYLSTNVYLVITEGRPTQLEVAVESIRGVDADELWRSVVGATWLVDRMDGNPLIEGSRITLAFDRSGGIQGKAVNTYTSAYERRGGYGLVVSPIASTRMYLDMPAGSMDQESRYFQLLRLADEYRLERGRLALLLDGGVVLELVPQP